MVYVVWQIFSNGVDTWKTLHSVWMTEEEAESRELNLTVQNEHPDSYEYSWEAIEVGRDLI